jgi:hypothetical protein
MSDYKDDLERFLETLNELAEFREASTRDRHLDARRRIENIVRVVTIGKARMFDSEREAREWTIDIMKQHGKLPADFKY